MLRRSSSSPACNDFNEPKTEVRFFCNDLRFGRRVSAAGVDAGIAADQAAVSVAASTDRRRTFPPLDHVLGLWDRPKKPELRREFFSLVKISSEGVRSWREGPKGGADEVEDELLNTLKLFLRSLLLRSSAIAIFCYGQDSQGNGKRVELVWNGVKVVRDDLISLTTPTSCSLPKEISVRQDYEGSTMVNLVWGSQHTPGGEGEEAGRWRERGGTYIRPLRRHEKQLMGGQDKRDKKIHPTQWVLENCTPRCVW